MRSTFQRNCSLARTMRSTTTWQGQKQRAWHVNGWHEPWIFLYDIPLFREGQDEMQEQRGL